MGVLKKLFEGSPEGTGIWKAKERLKEFVHEIVEVKKVLRALHCLVLVKYKVLDKN